MMKLSCQLDYHLTIDNECVCERLALPEFNLLSDEEWTKFKDGANIKEDK